jgi:hypothetical protein
MWLNLHKRYLLWCQAMGMCGLSSMKDICHGVDQWYVWLNLHERYLLWCQAMGMCGLSSMKDICHGVDQWYVWLNLNERFLSWCQAMVCVACPPWEIFVMVSGNMCGLSSMRDICHGVGQWYVWLVLHERYLSWCQAMVCVACPLWEISVMVSGNGMCGLSSMRDICHGVRQWYVWLKLSSMKDICHGVNQWCGWDDSDWRRMLRILCVEIGVIFVGFQFYIYVTHCHPLLTNLVIFHYFSDLGRESSWCFSIYHSYICCIFYIWCC